MTRYIRLSNKPPPRRVLPPASAATAAGADSDAIHGNVAGEISALTLVTAVSGDHVLIEDASDSNNKKRVAASDFLGGGGGATVPAWVAYMNARQSGETSHADDDFFTDGTLAGTAQTVSGTATWQEIYDLMSVKFVNQTSGDAAARLLSLTPTASPVTIETAVEVLRATTSFPLVALCFTDGTATTSNVAAVRHYIINTGVSRFNFGAGTLTAVDSGTNADQASGFDAGLTSTLFMRLVWSAANTFKASWSKQAGGPYTNLGTATYAKTMTPTHFGVYVSSFGGAEESTAHFHYLRVNETDLAP